MASEVTHIRKSLMKKLDGKTRKQITEISKIQTKSRPLLDISILYSIDPE